LSGNFACSQIIASQRHRTIVIEESLVSREEEWQTKDTKELSQKKLLDNE